MLAAACCCRARAHPRSCTRAAATPMNSTWCWRSSRCRRPRRAGGSCRTAAAGGSCTRAPPRAPARCARHCSATAGTRSRSWATSRATPAPSNACHSRGACSRKPARATRRASGCSAPASSGFARSALEALLAATLTHAFALPTFRAQERAERRIRRVVLLGSSGFDARTSSRAPAAPIWRAGSPRCRRTCWTPPATAKPSRAWRASTRCSCAGWMSRRCGAPAPMPFWRWRPATARAAPASRT